MCMPMTQPEPMVSGPLLPCELCDLAETCDGSDCVKISTLDMGDEIDEEERYA